jgi:hypothetical protein
MKQRLLITIFFFSLGIQLFSQNSYQLVISSNNDEVCRDLAILPDGGLIMTYISRIEYSSAFSCHIIRINALGEIINDVSISNPDGDCIIHNILSIGGGSFLGLGEWKHQGGNSEIWYIGFDTNLSIQWEKKYLIQANWIARLHSFIDSNGYIVSGAQISPVQWILNSGMLFITATPSGDTLQSVYKYSGDYYPIFDFFNQGANYKALARENIYSLSSILTLDSSLNIISSYPIPYQISNCMTGKPISDTSMYIAGNGIDGVAGNDIGIVKLNSPNTLSLSNHFGMAGDTVDYGGADQSMDFIDPNNIFVAGTSNIDLTYGYYSTAPAWYNLSNLDSLLNIRWTKYYFGDACYVLRNVTATPDGGVILSGTRYDYENPGNKLDICILKVDHNGLFTGLEENPQAKAHDAIVYPNPGIEYLNIQSGPQITGAEFYLFDVNGKAIMIEKITNILLKVNTAYLPAGTYPWQIVFKNKVIESGKWVKN